MANPESKANLQKFLAQCFQEHCEHIPDDTTVILGGMLESSEETVCITSMSHSRIDDLACKDHEEADTRVIAHLAYCASQLGIPSRAVVHATNTDIIMLTYIICARVTV